MVAAAIASDSPLPDSPDPPDPPSILDHSSFPDQSPISPPPFQSQIYLLICSVSRFELLSTRYVSSLSLSFSQGPRFRCAGAEMVNRFVRVFQGNCVSSNHISRVENANFVVEINPTLTDRVSIPKILFTNPLVFVKGSFTQLPCVFVGENCHIYSLVECYVLLNSPFGGNCFIAGKKILDFSLEVKQDSHSVTASLVEALAMVAAIASASTMEIPHLHVELLLVWNTNEMKEFEIVFKKNNFPRKGGECSINGRTHKT
ncbi:unnamed protein product [Arabis nemorensis]|uniref:Uncharacterized protein n=1 Tax=Arabis nemorensis TaxID=586526 RepID=A0A565C6E1_9BRAS|nr:unnamed protein product [Arabis nemorensis]